MMMLTHVFFSKIDSKNDHQIKLLELNKIPTLQKQFCHTEDGMSVDGHAPPQMLYLDSLSPYIWLAI